MDFFPRVISRDVEREVEPRKGARPRRLSERDGPRARARSGEGRSNVTHLYVERLPCRPPTHRARLGEGTRSRPSCGCVRYSFAARWTVLAKSLYVDRRHALVPGHMAAFSGSGTATQPFGARGPHVAGGWLLMATLRQGLTQACTALSRDSLWLEDGEIVWALLRQRTRATQSVSAVYPQYEGALKHGFY